MRSEVVEALRTVTAHHDDACAISNVSRLACQIQGELKIRRVFVRRMPPDVDTFFDRSIDGDWIHRVEVADEHVDSQPERTCVVVAVVGSDDPVWGR